MSAPAVTVMIPTRRRPASLERAVRSVFGQTGVAGLQLVVVDNDPAGSAAWTAEALRAEAPWPLIYVHEPTPGVANARNAGMAAAEAPLIAFLDDDEEAEPDWLQRLLAARERWHADAVFGPVRTRLPNSVVENRAYFERFFAREGPAESGVLDRHYGCGNSLVRRAAMPDPQRPFSAERNEIGGEDDLLFGQMGAAGATFVWAADAVVWEHPEPSRITLEYTLKRAFAYGQGPCAAAAAAEPPRPLGVVGWMTVGVGQTALYGLEAAFKTLTRRSDRVFALHRLAGSLGKIFWWGPFKIGFYGQPATGAAA